MTRRKAPLQVNSFSRGLLTEINPLETSLEHTSDELNMDLLRNRSRKTRVGFDLQDTNYIIDSLVTYDSSKKLGVSQYEWENAGGNPEKILTVAQVGDCLSIFDSDVTPLANGLIYKENTGADYDATFSYATVESFLVVCTGQKEVCVYEYEEDTNTITKSSLTLRIRDLFGVAATGSTNTLIDVDLTDPQYIGIRPIFGGSDHIYNLRNQGWHSSLYRNNMEASEDPIRSFRFAASSTVWPSNTDLINEFIYPDPNDTGNRLIDRYFADNHFQSLRRSQQAPRGYYIIDALERGESRLSVAQAQFSEDSILKYNVATLPTDKTPNGASTVAEFSGRTWFAGFSSELIGGDSRSPRMSSYILFSRLVKSKNDIIQCYQESDPTHREDNSLLDTDGGFIRIDDAHSINKLVSLRDSLFVFSETGVWRISGQEGAAFTATAYEQNKLTERGCISGSSVVVTEDQIFYWNEHAIYNIYRNEFGDWVVENRTRETINTLFSNIPVENKRKTFGFYDDFTQQIRWVYNRVQNTNTTDTDNHELIYDMIFGAFTKNKVGVYNTTDRLPKIVGVSRTNSYPAEDLTFTVTDNMGVTVVDNSANDVVVTEAVRSNDISTSIYLVVTDISSTIKFSFGIYNDTTNYDWADSGSTVGYENYIITTPLTAGEPRSSKMVPYLQTFFKRTETGFDTDLNPTAESSCMVSSRWGWSDNTVSGKWSTERQAYRYNRLYIPSLSTETLETGLDVIHTRNKLRGSGKSVQFKFAGENGKGFELLGWAFNLLASNED